MKRKVLITPSTMFMPGHAQRVLAELGAGPILTDPASGRITCHLEQHQIDMWGIKGPMHRLDIAPEVEPAAHVEPVVDIASHETTVREVLDTEPPSITVTGPGGKVEKVPVVIGKAK